MIDGTLDFVNDQDVEFGDDFREELLKNYGENAYLHHSNFDSLEEFVERIVGICEVNTVYEFHTPTVNSNIIYLATSNDFKEALSELSSNSEFILIDSTHRKIIEEDVDKIIKYFK